MRDSIHIYPVEQSNGLENLIRRSSAFVTAKINNLKQDKTNIDKFIEFIKQNLQSQANVQTLEDLIGQEQPDLALIVSILVSSGWNLNDDVFLADELWSARTSPMHKPINDDHDDTSIIGHIVHSRVLDKAGNELNSLDGNQEIDIEAAGVLYKFLPGIQSRVNQIIEKANNNEVFVSMECFFDNFDYSLKDLTTGKTGIIQRDEATAFLTKHLRAYGGTGKFNNYLVGRVLRNIVFGGQGVVENPANPESVIKLAASLNFPEEGGAKEMTDKEKELQKQLEEITASSKTKDEQIAGANQKLEEAEAQRDMWKTKVEEYDRENQKFLAESKTALEQSKNDNAELAKALKESNDKVQELENQVNAFKKEQVAKERFEKLSQVATISDKEATVKELAEMSEKEFQNVVKYASLNKVETNKESSEASIDELKIEEDKDDVDLQPGSDKTEDDLQKVALATAKCLLNRTNEKGN